MRTDRPGGLPLFQRFALRRLSARASRAWVIRTIVALTLVGASIAPQQAAGSDPCASNTLPEPLPTHPGPENAGVPDDVSLTTIHGDYRTSVYGQVINRLNITGELFIDHDNVKVKCTRVWRMTTNNGTGLQMWLSTLGDSRGVRHGSALKWRDYTLRRVEIMGTFDGLKAEGNVDVRDSYIHDLYRTTDSTQSSGMTHNDGVQIDRGDNMVFKHNTFYMWSFTDGEQAGQHLLKTPYGDGEGYMTSAFVIPGGRNVSNVLIEDNLIRGRTSKYIHVAAGARNVRIVRNIMGQENRDYPTLWAVRDETATEGNVLLDGRPADSDP